MRLLPLLLMIPVFTTGQDVQPIIAKDYLELIRKGQQQIIRLPADTGKEFTDGIFHFRENYYSGQTIKKIKPINGTILLKYASPNTILIGGNFTTLLEIKTINQLPAIHTQYAQGRSENGILVWRGAETGELFSYGPALNSLEYDGSLYDYDLNGRLVPKGNGNGKAANNYSYRLFRTAIHLNQSATISLKWKKGIQQVAQSSIKWGRSRENLVIPGNDNKADNFSTSLEIQTRPWLITGNYSNYTDRFSHSNRNGFFNRAYQNALLTPSSFDNSQGTQLGIGQRSYSNLADNPDFLLKNNINGNVQKNRTASLSVEKRYRGFHYQVLQSVASLRQNSLESFQPGTAFFPLGFSNQRLKNETHYFLRANASYEFEPNHFDLRSEIVVNYIYSGHHSSIEYPAYRLYRHQRSASDFDFRYSGSWYKNQLDVGIKLNNKFHFSNTTTKTTLFLPGSSAWLQWGGNLKTKLSASMSQFNSELPLNSSFAQTQFLKNSTLEVWSIYPTLEVRTYNGLDPIRSREWSARLELDYKNRFFLHGDAFRRK
ncbi:MAG TPA: hypothetical protein VFO70_11545 [Chitinophagaceae bacterium]|nr:hypothetical protein [Chitinophagaceae bacterium]